MYLIPIGNDTLLAALISQIDNFHLVIGLYIHLVESIDKRIANVDRFSLLTPRKRFRQDTILSLYQKGLRIIHTAIIGRHSSQPLVFSLQDKTKGK